MEFSKIIKYASMKKFDRIAEIIYAEDGRTEKPTTKTSIIR